MPDHAIAKRRAANQFTTEHDLIEAIEERAVLRVRPKAMTVAVNVAGFLPIMFRQRHWLGGHAQNRGTHGWRHDHCATSIDAGVTGSVLVARYGRLLNHDRCNLSRVRLRFLSGCSDLMVCNHPFDF